MVPYEAADSNESLCDAHERQRFVQPGSASTRQSDDRGRPVRAQKRGELSDRAKCLTPPTVIRAWEESLPRGSHRERAQAVAGGRPGVDWRSAIGSTRSSARPPSARFHHASTASRSRIRTGDPGRPLTSSASRTRPARRLARAEVGRPPLVRSATVLRASPALLRAAPRHPPSRPFSSCGGASWSFRLPSVAVLPSARSCALSSRCRCRGARWPAPR
jgi:hypothetical protein